MDYMDILKRAWRITWRYKALWVLGFFAASASGGGGSSGGRVTDTSSWQTSDTAEFQRAGEWIVDHLPALIAIGVFFLLLGLGFFILSVAARGGLVHEVNEAEERREVSLGRGWGRGFHFWGRTFGIGFLLGLPIFLVVGGFIAFIVIGAINLGLGGDPSETAVAGFVSSILCGLPLFLVFVVPLGIAVSILNEIAVRYGVLHDMRVGAAIGRSWRDLVGRKGTIVMWLVMILPGIVYGIVVGVVAAIFAIPAVLLAIAENYVAAVSLFALLALVMLVPGAAYGTFTSSAWTVFFRRMTGIESTSATVAVPQPAGYSGGYVPPPPPTAPEYPPAPPAAPEYPPAPPTAPEYPPAPPAAPEYPPAPPPAPPAAPEYPPAPPTAPEE